MAWLASSVVLCSCASPRNAADLVHQRPTDPLLPATNPVARVFIFVSNDCPIANRYAPDLRRLHQVYTPRGVAVWLVHADPEETLASVRQHDREYNLNLPVALDPDHSLAKLCHAEVTPSAAVFTADGQLVYRGRIDDRFVELGRERPEPSRRDLQEAIEAVLAKRPVPVPVTKAIGCYLP